MARIRNSRSHTPPADPKSPRNQYLDVGRCRKTTRRTPGSAHVLEPLATRSSVKKRQTSWPPVRRSPSQGRAAQTVDAIVIAASRILVERGYGSASTNAIAERAGVSIGSLYQYFRHKEDIFRELVRRHRGEVVPVIRHALEQMTAPSADIVAMTLDLLREMAKVNARDPPLLEAIDRELGFLHREGDSEVSLCEAVAAILHARRSDNGFPPDVTATLLVTTVAPLSRWIVHSKPASLDAEQIIRAFGMMLSGLLGAAHDRTEKGTAT